MVSKAIKQLCEHARTGPPARNARVVWWTILHSRASRVMVAIADELIARRVRPEADPEVPDVRTLDGLLREIATRHVASIGRANRVQQLQAMLWYAEMLQSMAVVATER